MDGQPDVQGHWSNTIGNHNNFTRPQGGDEGAPGGGARERSQGNRAPSRVSDPVDGEIPYQPWARARAQDFGAHLDDPTRPEYVEPLARCAPAGPTKSFMWHGYEIRHGQTAQHPAMAPARAVLADGLGWQNAEGNVLGVYLHGLFEDPNVLHALCGAAAPTLDSVFDGLADFIDAHFAPGVLRGLIQ